MLDADLLSFIRSSIRSTWALELLLHARTQSGRTLTVEELVRELRGTPLLIRTCLRQLQQAELMVCEDENTCRYAPPPTLATLSDQLALAYQERPMAVINAILDQPNERLQSFADAFRFTKKDDKKDD